RRLLVSDRSSLSSGVFDGTAAALMRALLWLRSSASTRSLRACSSVFSSSNAFWRACLSEACSQLGPGFCGRNLSDSCGTKPLVSTYLRASSIFLSRKFMPVEVLSKPWRARFELLSKKKFFYQAQIGWRGRYYATEGHLSS